MIEKEVTTLTVDALEDHLKFTWGELNRPRREQYLKLLKESPDPTLAHTNGFNTPKVKVAAVFDVVAPDARGLIEVLAKSPDGEPFIAWFREKALIYLEEGW